MTRPARPRQMHLGVFWLGTGNHSAGWRYEGAAASNCSWPVVLEGAQIAERGKFDLFFISDSVVMDPGDHPSFVARFEPTTLIAALSAVTRCVGLGQSWLSPTNALSLVSQRIGHDITGYPLDGPVPDFPEKTERGQAFSRALLEMARREKMTLRDLYNITAAARGHWVIYGTPARIADIFEEWFCGGMADGFIIMPAYFPGAFNDFVDLVVPELQRRGLYRKDYAGPTLRAHLGTAALESERPREPAVSSS